MLTRVHYLYRDAGNFKSWGMLTLEGKLSTSEQQSFVEKLEMGELFIAEQVGVPTLYAALYALSGGRINSDHAWHSFVRFEELFEDSSDGIIWGTAPQFRDAFAAVQEWDVRLSPNCGMTTA